jgi:hypothetical protein
VVARSQPDRCLEVVRILQVSTCMVQSGNPWILRMLWYFPKVDIGKIHLIFVEVAINI